MIQVSVVIPTHNRAHTLKRALDSVLAQRGVSFEVIVVDDGSTDETRELIASSPHLLPREGAKVKYFYQPNRGPAAARNLGIVRTSAQFIAFLDSDDEWLPGKLAAQLQFFEENPDYLICQTEEIWIRNGKRVNPMKKHKKFGGWIFEKCLPLCIVSPSAVMMRREFFDRIGLFDESFPACEDYELWLRASAQIPIGLIEKPFLIKYGGHLPAARLPPACRPPAGRAGTGRDGQGQAGADQRSQQFPVMDEFRIRALHKLIESGVLSPTQWEAVFNELRHKCQIVSRGAQKRGKTGEAQYYSNLVAALRNSSAGRDTFANS